VAILARFALTLALFSVPSGAMALERINTPNTQGNEKTPQIAVGVVCNTPEQLQQYLKLHIGGAEPAAALETVNTEAHDPLACGVLATAFIETKEISHVSISSGILRLVQVTIIATRSPLGWQRVQPTVQYTALFIKTQEI
jgi:hypothetical protein